ncbi:MAG: acetolactate synthase [Gemmatimonadetes bacterium]|nr:acetolactate synthase [Gemmatimonadota bacterium]
MVRPVASQPALLLQTDFGLAEGSIAEMKGVAFSVDRNLRIFDLTHLIPPYDVWEAAVRLQQAAPFWPTGTVFVSIVDPGVGTARRAVVVQSKTGHFFVGPDNGTFTFVAERLGIAAVREIDETINRLVGSERSHTFHGRDIFAYTGARLAAGAIDFEGVGPLVAGGVVELPHAAPVAVGSVIRGTILALDQPFGNVWTNIRAGVLDSAGVRLGDSLAVTIRSGGTIRFQGRLPFVKSFGAVGRDRPLAYLDSLLDLAFALNQASFASRYRVGRGAEWQVEVVVPSRKR